MIEYVVKDARETSISIVENGSFKLIENNIDKKKCLNNEEIVKELGILMDKSQESCRELWVVVVKKNFKLDQKNKKKKKKDMNVVVMN